jgi:hypothetical protein
MPSLQGRYMTFRSPSMPPALQIATPPLNIMIVFISWGCLGETTWAARITNVHERYDALPHVSSSVRNLIMLRAALARRLCGTRLLSSAAGPHRVSSRSLPGLVPSLRDFMQPSEASKIGEANPAPYIDPQLLMGGGRRVYLETYGCQMNVADTEVIRSLLNTAGFERAGSIDEADVVLLNT